MRGLVQLQNTLKMIRENLNPDVEIEGILPTMLDSRTVHAKEAVEILEENFGDLVFKSRIRKAIKFAEAPVKGAQRPQVRSGRQAPRATTATWRRRFWRMARRNKRASMREGPLADLFRSTDESDDRPSRGPPRGTAPSRSSPPGGAAPEPVPSRPPSPSPSRRRPGPSRARAASRSRADAARARAASTETPAASACSESSPSEPRSAARSSPIVETPRYGREEPDVRAARQRRAAPRR